jgi:hypothetical protein
MKCEVWNSDAGRATIKAYLPIDLKTVIIHYRYPHIIFAASPANGIISKRIQNHIIRDGPGLVSLDSQAM